MGSTTKSNDSGSSLQKEFDRLTSEKAKSYLDEILAENFRSIAYAEAHVLIRGSAPWLSQTTVEFMAILVSCE